MTAPARITADVYSPDGATLVSSIDLPDKAAFRDEVSQRGNANFRAKLLDAADIVADSIVKFSWLGAVRFGCVINAENCELVADGDNKRWVEFNNQLGLLSLFDQATIQPEYGLGRRSGDTRNCGYMSKLGAWLISGDWLLPEYVTYSDETGPRHNHPPELKPATGAPEPAWIAATPGPDTTVATGTKNWFRYPFTLADDVNTRVVYATDNYGNAYFDGEQTGTANMNDAWAWLNAVSFDQFMVAGDHVLGFDVENAPSEAGHTFNPIGLICTVYTLDNKGEPDGVLFTSNPVDYPDWRVSKVKPGWHKGYAAKTFIDEAQARDVFGASLLTPTFTDTEDSNGDPWDDEVDQYAFGIATTSLTDVLIALAESGINFHVNAATMELDAFNRKGTDLYDSVEYKLGDHPDGDGSLISYPYDWVTARATSIDVHLEDGTWLKVEDATAIADPTIGRREVGYTLGTAPNADAAQTFALQQLAESASERLQVTAKASVQMGPQFYLDHDLGDSVKLPGRRNSGNIKGRGLAVTVAQTADRAEVSVDYMQDAS
jgi:hypothetical protein